MRAALGRVHWAGGRVPSFLFGCTEPCFLLGVRDPSFVPLDFPLMRTGIKSKFKNEKTRVPRNVRRDE